MEEKGQRGCWRIVRRFAKVCAVVFVLLVIAAFILWRSEWPQRKLIAYAAREYLGAEIIAANISTYPAFVIEKLSIYDGHNDGRQDAAASAMMVRVDYDARPASGRYISRIHIRTLDIVLDASNPEDTNYDFLLRLLEPSDDEPIDPKYLPQQVVIDNLSIYAHSGDVAYQFADLNFTADITSTEQIHAAIDAEKMFARWGFEKKFVEDFRIGQLRAAVEYADGTAAVELSTAIPDLLEADARVELQFAENNIGLNVIAKTIRIYGGELPQQLRDRLPVPVEFEKIELTDATVSTRIADGTPAFPDATFAASVKALRIGEREHEYYTGDLTFDAQAHRGETNEATFQLALDQGQRLRGAIKGDVDAGELQAAIENWSPEDVRGAVPVDFRSALDAVDYESAGGYMTAKWSGEGYAVDANIQSHGATESADPIHLTLTAHGGAESAPLIEGTLGAKLGQGAIHAALRADSEDVYHATVTLAGVDARRWTGFLAKASLPEDVAATLAGTIAVEAQADVPNAALRPELTFTEVVAAGRSFETITVTGALAMDKKFGAVNGGDLTATVDDTHSISLSGTHLKFDMMSGTAQLAAKVDIFPFVADTGYSDLYGEAEITGPLELNDGNLTGPLTLTSSLFGYGDYGIPYGKTLEATAQLALNTEDNTGTLANLKAAIPERATIASPSVAFVLSPFSARGDTTFEANGVLIVDMAVLPEAEGTANGTAAFVYDTDSGFTANWTATVEAQRFALPDQVAHVEQLAAQASGSYDGGIVGEGNVTAAVITAAGAHLREVSGAIVGSGDTFRIGGVTGTLFNGPVIADVSVGLFEDNLPIYLSAQYEGIDLARLTEEVQPPQVRLTGIAAGSATLQYSRAGLEDFTVRAKSNENLSLDRETVEELIFREKILERFSTRQLEKILREFAGEAPQRPFDSGDLYLRLEEGRIQGTAELASEKTRDLRGLTLIVNLAIDPEQLAETFVLLEKGELDRVEL